MARSLEERARWFSWRRQLLGHSGGDPLEALRSVIAVYSSQPSGPLSLLARVKKLSPADYEGLVASKQVLRMPVMRTSIHVVPRDTAERVFAATIGSAKWVDPGLRYYKISDADYQRARKRVLAEAREPLSSKELRERLGLERQMVAPVLAAMCREGSLLRAGSRSLRSNAQDYVATEAWLGKALGRPNAKKAREWLAREYLRAFGPVRVEDFAWWTGVERPLAERALAAADTVDLGDGYLLRREDEAELSRARAKRGAVAVLPRWDAYQMGYAPDGRGRFANADVLDRVYESSGDGMPMVLVEGRAAGIWSSRFAGKRMEVALEMFDKPGKQLRAAIERELEGVAALLGAGELKVADGTASRRR